MMRNAQVIAAIATTAVLSACSTSKPNNSVNYASMNNPLLVKSPLQYQAPQFDKIKNEHFKQAFDLGIQQHNADIQTITSNKAAATFENTVVALENSGEILRRALSVFYNFTSANTNPQIQALEQEYAPKFAAHNDGIYLNDQLFQRIKSVYNNRAALKDAEDKKLVEYYYDKFEMAGANLSDANKAALKKLNAEEAGLIAQYTSKLLAARKAGGVFFNNASDLAGLSTEEIEAAKSDAKAAGQEGKYLLNLSNTTQQPLLQNLSNRTTRERLFRASWTRAEKGDANDTRALIEQIAKLRLRKAQLMGKPNFASWKLQDQMAKTPDAAVQLLRKIATPALAKAREEANEIQALIDKQKGGFKLEPWDWNFYAEQVRKAKYDLDENEIKPYFEVTTVLEKGVFYAAEKLYGVTFKERKDLPVYHPDVVTYEVFDRDGKSLAIYYLDFFTRDNKSGGAWMSNFVDQSFSLKQKPVITNVYNYAKPAPGRPSLISWDDVTTMFHEFGHSIHGLFANQKYVSLSGTATPRDFVEFPSQINEHWAMEPSVLKNYALHYQTKQPIPQNLVDKMKNAAKFNQGYASTEVAAAAALDMAWHTITSEAQISNANDFETKALKDFGLYMKEVPTRYHSPYFLHIWGNGYSAGYYAYMWSEMLDNDAYDWFKNNGGMTRANGDRFRKYILSVGNTVDLNEAFKTFTGREADVKYLLKNRGFIN